MATEIRIEIETDPGRTSISVEHADEMIAFGEALGLLLATRGPRLTEAIQRARIVLDTFATGSLKSPEQNGSAPK